MQPASKKGKRSKKNCEKMDGWAWPLRSKSMRVLQAGRATTGEIVKDLDLAPERPRLAESRSRGDHAILGGRHFKVC